MLAERWAFSFILSTNINIIYIFLYKVVVCPIYFYIFDSETNKRHEKNTRNN